MKTTTPTQVGNTLCSSCYNLTDIAKDIKPNNILVDWHRDADDEIVVEQVQLTDLEDACFMPPNAAIVGLQPGNWMWHSPEAHAQGPCSESTDMFSLGLVVSLGEPSCAMGSPVEGGD